MRFLTAFVLLAPLLAAAAQTPAPASPASSAPASTSLTAYRNDTLRLSYSYPGDFVDATEMVGPAFEASLGQDPNAAMAAKCITLPFSRMQSGTGRIGLIVLVRADAGCLKKKFNAKSVAELAQGEAGGLAASGAKTSFGKPVSFEVANRPAALLQGSFTLPTGQTMQAMVTCVLDQPDVACWQFLSNTAAGLSALGAYPVTFDGSPATPLVPASVLAKP